MYINRDKTLKFLFPLKFHNHLKNHLKNHKNGTSYRRVCSPPKL